MGSEVDQTSRVKPLHLIHEELEKANRGKNKIQAQNNLVTQRDRRTQDSNQFRKLKTKSSLIHSFYLIFTSALYKYTKIYSVNYSKVFLRVKQCAKPFTCIVIRDINNQDLAEFSRKPRSIKPQRLYTAHLQSALRASMCELCVR